MAEKQQIELLHQQVNEVLEGIESLLQKVIELANTHNGEERREQCRRFSNYWGYLLSVDEHFSEKKPQNAALNAYVQTIMGCEKQYEPLRSQKTQLTTIASIKGTLSGEFKKLRENVFANLIKNPETVELPSDNPLPPSFSDYIQQKKRDYLDAPKKNLRLQIRRLRTRPTALLALAIVSALLILVAVHPLTYIILASVLAGCAVLSFAYQRYQYKKALVASSDVAEREREDNAKKFFPEIDEQLSQKKVLESMSTYGNVNNQIANDTQNLQNPPQSQQTLYKPPDSYSDYTPGDNSYVPNQTIYGSPINYPNNVEVSGDGNGEQPSSNPPQKKPKLDPKDNVELPPAYLNLN